MCITDRSIISEYLNRNSKHDFLIIFITFSRSSILHLTFREFIFFISGFLGNHLSSKRMMTSSKVTSQRISCRKFSPQITVLIPKSGNMSLISEENGYLQRWFLNLGDLQPPPPSILHAKNALFLCVFFISANEYQSTKH